MNADEQQLWQRVQRGDEPAFRQLYQQHAPYLLNYGLRLHGSLAAAEDCLQELFLELWQYRQTLTQPASVRFYLLKAFRNRLNARYRRDRPLVSGWDDEQLTPFSIEPSAEQRLIELDMDDALRRRVQQALAGLSPRQREILYLRYFNDLSYEQICELLQINYQTARSQVYQALKALRNHTRYDWLGVFSLVFFRF